MIGLCVCCSGNNYASVESLTQGGTPPPSRVQFRFQRAFFVERVTLVPSRHYFFGKPAAAAVAATTGVLSLAYGSVKSASGWAPLEGVHLLTASQRIPYVDSLRLPLDVLVSGLPAEFGFDPVATAALQLEVHAAGASGLFAEVKVFNRPAVFRRIEGGACVDSRYANAHAWAGAAVRPAMAAIGAWTSSSTVELDGTDHQCAAECAASPDCVAYITRGGTECGHVEWPAGAGSLVSPQQPLVAPVHNEAGGAVSFHCFRRTAARTDRHPWCHVSNTTECSALWTSELFEGTRLATNQGGVCNDTAVALVFCDGWEPVSPLPLQPFPSAHWATTGTSVRAWIWGIASLAPRRPALLCVCLLPGRRLVVRNCVVGPERHSATFWGRPSQRRRVQTWWWAGRVQTPMSNNGWMLGHHDVRRFPSRQQLLGLG